jgi:hypothetical protein
LPWSQFSGAGTFTAGTGLTLTGTVFSLTSPVAVANGGTGLTSLGTGVATFLGTPSSANLAAAVSDETGTGALVFANSPTLVSPALGTPSSGTVTNLTGTASININGTVGATTPSTGVFTALTVNDNSTLGSSNSDTVNFNARVASDLVPSTDNSFDLGVTGHEWRNLNIDGTANIDSLVADTADINGGTIDGTTIGATTPSTVAGRRWRRKREYYSAGAGGTGAVVSTLAVMVGLHLRVKVCPVFTRQRRENYNGDGNCYYGGQRIKLSATLFTQGSNDVLLIWAGGGGNVLGPSPPPA